MNLFERAARKKYRFNSSVGLVTAEQLFDLPLTGGSACLNDVAVSAYEQLQAATSKSFVDTASPETTDLQGKLDLVKHVIKVKQDAIAATEKRVANANKKAKLLEALSAQESKELDSKSKEELLAELEAIDND